MRKKPAKKIQLLTPVWERIFRRAWVLTLVLFLALGGLRVYGLWGPEGAALLVMVTFLLMWFLPFIFFTQEGRQAAGIRKPKRPLWLLWGLLAGWAAALVVFGLGLLLFGKGPDNWYVSVLASWRIDATMLELPAYALFLIYTLPAILFSPLGEEFFFRGLVHVSVEEKWGQRAGVLVSALAFAGIHLFHHGLLLEAGGVRFSALSGILWFLLMAWLSWVFSLLRQRSGSLWPAVAAHAAFNLVMNITIFTVFL
ncbi:MAG: CPBP family intramembrane metalloprotease [Anaerolineales bacterium]|nr:CPBP family intramembrane metalloprotease [Anaerolineales bacterium]